MYVLLLIQEFISKVNEKRPNEIFMTYKNHIIILIDSRKKEFSLLLYFSSGKKAIFQ